MLPTDQARDALSQGGVTAFADKNPHSQEYTQYASLIKNILKKTLPLDNVATETDGVAGRVPEPATEAIMPSGVSYSQTQEGLSPQMLSEGGLERFQAAGGDAQIATNLPTDPTELSAAMATAEKTSDETLTETAQKAVNDFDTGAFPEGDALDVFEMFVNRGALIQTDEGIDFNFNKFESGEEILAVVNAVSEVIANPTEAAKRGIKTNKETLEVAQQKLADEIGFTKQILKMKSGDLLKAEDMTALRIMLQKSAENLSNVAKEIEAGDDSSITLLKFRKLMSVHAGLQMKAKGAQTEIARALQSFQIPVGARTNVDAAEAVTQMLQDGGGVNHTKGLVKGYLKALEGGQANANKFVYSGWDSKAKGVFHEIYINGMLAYPKTQLKNGFATPIWMAYNQLVDLSIAVAGKARKQFDKDYFETITFDDVAARWHGFRQSIADAWVVANKSFATEVPADQASKIEFNQYKQIDSENLRIAGAYGKGVDWFGKMIRIPGRLLTAVDDFWRVVNSRGVLYEEAHRKARQTLANGGTDQEAVDNAMMVLLDPRSVSKEMDAAARYATLTQDLPQALGALTRVVQKDFFGRLILPFAKAPTNAIRMVADGHPLWAALRLTTPNGRKLLLGSPDVDPKLTDRARARLAMGTATMYYFYSLAQNGRMTGAMPSDQKVRNMLPPGWQPYSFVFRGKDFPKDEDGDFLPIWDKYGNPNGKLLYVNYSGLEPVSAFLGISADTAERMRRISDPAERTNFISASGMATFNYFKELPFLQGMGEIFAAIEYEDPSIIYRSPMQSTLGVLPMPYSAVVRNVDKLQDPTYKKVSNDLQYYSIEDVQAMYDKSLEERYPLDEVPYHLVGTVKDYSHSQFFQQEFINLWRNQMKNNPWHEENVTDYQYRYDMLGQKIESSVPYSVNPVAALWNSMTPFKISRSEEMPEWHKELVKLGAPLAVEKKTMHGISLPKYFRGELNQVAKNEVVLPAYEGMPPQTFRKALETLLGSVDFLTSKDEDQVRKIKKLENAFYQQGFEILLFKEENKDILQAYTEKKLVKEYAQ
tara:strand:+ start:2944 stop:6090 length:3147 start_codon:yes stop_codon:yes gene_type:complete